jgi:hypothetical protein
MGTPICFPFPMVTLARMPTDSLDYLAAFWKYPMRLLTRDAQGNDTTVMAQPNSHRGRNRSLTDSMKGRKLRLSAQTYGRSSIEARDDAMAIHSLMQYSVPKDTQSLA